MKRGLWTGILLLTLLLSGCGEAEKMEEKADTREAYVHATLFCGVDFWHAPEWDVTEGTITGDISRETGVVIDVMPRLGKPNRQLSLMLVNNELPDIISVTDETVIHQLVTSGKVWKLDEFLETYCPDSHILTEFPEDIKYELIKRDGAWYAWPSHINSRDARKIWKASAPRYREISELGNPGGIMWNRKLLEELGIEAEELQTEDEVLQAWEKAKARGDIQPLLIDGDAWQAFSLAFLQATFGAEYVDDAGNYLDEIRQPETKKALAFLNQAMREGYASVEQMLFTNDQIKEKMASGKVLCFIGNVCNTGVDARKWISSGVIQGKDGERPVQGRKLQATTGWINTFIAKDCRYPEQIAAWLDDMTSEAGMRRWCFGDEGADYVLDEKGRIKLTEEGEKARAAGSETDVNIWWMFNNTAWERSVLAPYEEGSQIQADETIQTAYAKNEKTVIYNKSLVTDLLQNFPEDGEERKMDAVLEQWKKVQLPKVVLASDEAAFEQEYETLMKGLRNRGIEELDQVKNEVYQARCQEYGEKLKKINSTESRGTE
ncbi:hypothetical protein [Laedolimicola sp.]|uniref:hypothetical protein n=1 Tax=Laedolimicola sp. TaxID=2981663 RepID=UPI003F8023FD